MLRRYATAGRRRSLLYDTLRAALWMCLALAAGALAVQHTLQLSGLFPWKVTAVFAAGCALTLWLAARHLAARAFGPANEVTLARGGLIAVLLGLIGEPPAAWLVVAIASAVLVLDGIDGWLARRCGVASAFGARFDMETDTLLLVALSALAWHHDKAGSWVLLAGLLRYGFVASGYLWTSLARPLPPRRRRQTAFVFQAIALIVCVSPVVVQPLSGAVALLGLAVLSGSFAIDVVDLLRAGRARRPGA